MPREMDVNDAKMKALRDVLGSIPEFINDLCAMRKGFYEVKQVEWEEKVRKIKAELESELMLLFIGPFASGKSTFVNALLGEALLPVADGPCTSIVTELSFKKGGGHEGKIFRFDESEENGNYEELINMINGPRGAVGELGGIHHIELLFDVTELKDWEKHPLSNLMTLNVKVVDCPGFGSPYPIRDEVIKGYVNKASYTFWMSRVDKFGGKVAERILGDIKRKTITMIPVITMADLINDEQREQTTEDFYTSLGEFFKKKEPLFVSAHKWNEAMELTKRLDSVNRNNEMTPEERKKMRQKVDKLRIDSGLERIFQEMILSGRREEANEAKLAAALPELSGLLKEMNGQAEKEAGYWLREAEKMGFSEDDAYKKLNEIKVRVGAWIKQESKEVADNLETAMIKELADYIVEVNGRGESGRATEITVNLWEREFNKHKNEWAERLCREYKEYVDEYSVKFSGDKVIEAPKIPKTVFDLKNILDIISKALDVDGGTSVFRGGLGTALIVTAPAIKTVEVLGVTVGTLVAPVAVTVGVVLIGVAAIALYHPIQSRIDYHRKQMREETESLLREWIDKVDLAPTIHTILNEENKRLYESYKLHYSADLKPIESNLNRSREIKDEISNMEERILTYFPNELQRR